MIEPRPRVACPRSARLLERLHLPLAGIEAHLPTMLVAREGEQITLATIAQVVNAERLCCRFLRFVITVA
jgi:hypothetical protein